MKRIFIAFVSVVLSSTALAQNPSDGQRAQHEKEHEEVVTLFRSETGFEEIDRGEVIQFIDNKRSRVFLVTKPGHPAHPAVVTRQAIEQDGKIFIKSNGVGRGDKQAMKTWIDFLDSQGKKSVEHKRQEANKP